MIADLACAGFLLAHQGGWDEALFAIGPLAVFAALLAVANRRASRTLPMPSDAPDNPDLSP